MSKPLTSIIVPVYFNEASLPLLLDRLSNLLDRDSTTEVVFVVDGSPDQSALLLKKWLPDARFASQLILLTRNFGAFRAIRAGLAASRGRMVAVMSADLQEPPELVMKLFQALDNEGTDVAVGVRRHRVDPASRRVTSALFWWLYRLLVNSEIPSGGVDIFACRRRVVDRLLASSESRTSLIGLLYWYGYSRSEVTYERGRRRHGRSAWSLKARMEYVADNVFSFTDLPIRVLLWLGAVALALLVALGVPILVARLTGLIPVPGFASTALLILFFSALNALGLGVVGSYAWRSYENTKLRPHYVVAESHVFDGPDE